MITASHMSVMEVKNHWKLDCFFNSLFGFTAKTISKLRVTRHWWIPLQIISVYAESFSMSSCKKVVGVFRVYQPGAPVKPGWPVGPGCPVAPGCPAGPGSPGIPDGPCGPGGPLLPGGPKGPVAPWIPIGPSGPMSPVEPIGPGSPKSPSWPGSPGKKHRLDHGPLTRYVKFRVAHAPRMPGTFSPPPISKKQPVSDPGMHHGTCLMHVPWCMSGSLTCGSGENVPGIPGATCNITYLARGPWLTSLSVELFEWIKIVIFELQYS